VDQQVALLVAGQHVDVVVELNPGQDVGVVLIGRDVDRGLPLLVFQRLQHFECLFNGASRPTAGRQRHVVLAVSAE